MNYEIKLYNEIGKKIKKARKKLNITQEKLAEMTNYSYSFIANIENKTYQSFSISALNNIAKALNTPMKELLPDENFEIISHQISCKNCNYEIEIPEEIEKILNTIEEISHKKIILTCPICHNKIK